MPIFDGGRASFPAYPPAETQMLWVTIVLLIVIAVRGMPVT
jgi:hypothetical protein